jgi:hypothetical protein
MNEMNSQEKNNKKKPAKKVTVSIRNMDRAVWCEGLHRAKLKGNNMSEYIERLIRKDLGKAAR